MTRINIIDPTHIMDQHLVAEYREIRLLCGSFKNSMKSKLGVSEARVPPKYTLLKGHIMFFHNKGEYLHKRYDLLKAEMVNRGWKPNFDFPMPKGIWPEHLYKDWTPTEEDFEVVRHRIGYRISQKPNWYRYYGKKAYDSNGAPLVELPFDWVKYFDAKELKKSKKK